METRIFGRTGMQLSVLGFGCGAVGGLMVRGDPVDQERTIARALAAGVNYFDTAVQYGNGESEKNLGRVLQSLKPANVAVGTKVRLPSGDFGDIANAVAKSLEGSLARLRLDRVDISTCTTRSPRPAAVKRSASDRCSVRWCRRSSGCVSRARSAFSGSPQSATPRRCTR
jgi:aryl-alcohol dehydrogenase-like predicted oxidoreductase